MAKEQPPPLRPDPFEPVGSAGGLWSIRAQFARASAALGRGDKSGAHSAASGVDDQALNLPGLVRWITLAAGSPNVDALLAFASSETLEPLARRALGQAAATAKTPAEKAAVSNAIDRWASAAPDTPRRHIAEALFRARVAPRDSDAAAVLEALVRRIPDAPERAPDLFDEKEVERLDAVCRRASPETRLARARVLASRRPSEATLLVTNLARTPDVRLAAAEILLQAGSARDAKRLLSEPSRPASAAEFASNHRDALALTAELRLLASPAREPRGRKRRAPVRRAAAVPNRSGFAATATPPVTPAALRSELERLMALPLAESDRRRLLSEAIRLELHAGQADAARKALLALREIDPLTTVGAEDHFSAAFARYLSGTPDGLFDAVRLFDEEASLYREVGARRRAMYWSARARARLGEADAARALYAALLPGTSSDLYGRWAAAALGVPLPQTGPPLATDDGLEPALPATSPGLPSRELLSCGFASLAEDQAESEHTLDPVFAAAVASERNEHRRAAGVLKTRYPELGTPEEGAVPLEARRAFYPLAQRALLGSAATTARVSPSLLFGLVRQESLFQENVRSRAGALGLMQVMPATGRLLLRAEHRKGRPNLTDPAVNVRLGAEYLAQLVQLFSGDEAAALAGYNAGPGRVVRWRRESPNLATDEFLESIPLSETRDYVKRVLFYQGAYAALYGIPDAPGGPDSPIVMRRE